MSSNTFFLGGGGGGGWGGLTVCVTYTDLIRTELLYLGLYFSFESLFFFFSLTGDFIYLFTLKLYLFNLNGFCLYLISVFTIIINALC